MRKFANTVTFLVAALTLSIGLSSCAARRAEALAKRPVADVVCVRIVGIGDPEQGLLIRKTTLFLKESGFQSGEEGCDLTINYTALDGTRWEVMTPGFLGFRSQSSYRVEGILTVSQGGKLVAEDQPVNLRDYASKSDVLDALAWEIVGYVTDHYRPAVPPRN
jgi:hypothetical protein